MKGTISTHQKCHECGGKFSYIEGTGIMQCLEHPRNLWQFNCFVRFGREHTKRFKTVREAERHLTRLRAQTDDGSLDLRDWKKDQPLAFRTLRRKFVEFKETGDIKSKQLRHIKNVLKTAGKDWDTLNIKEITEPEIDDFFLKIKEKSSKTRSNYKSVLHDFWKWIVRRERRRSKIEMPDFPDFKVKMGWRAIVTMEDQQRILDEIWRISKDTVPRVWLGIKLLTLFPKVRPGEMVDIEERHINLQDGWIFFPDPKEGDKGKFIHLSSEDCELIEAFWKPKGLPKMYFFRHLKSRSGVREGVQYGPKYFKKWWDKACNNLNIEGVDLYGGTKHSTVTALGQVMTPEQIQRGVTGHASDAFKRYMLPDVNEARIARQNIAKVQNKNGSRRDIDPRVIHLPKIITY